MARSANSRKGQPKRRNFSSFKLAEAFIQLGIEKLQPWSLEVEPIAPSEILKMNLQRLRKFDLRSTERGKELLIDAIFQEVVQSFETLKIWKSASIESDQLNGEVDYVVTKDRDYLKAPFLCVVEAKKDDFEKGLAQCLVEMQACQWNSQQEGSLIEIQGIVSNGTEWEFYQLLRTGVVRGPARYSMENLPGLLGGVHYLLELCQQALQS